METTSDEINGEHVPTKRDKRDERAGKGLARKVVAEQDEG